MWGSPRVEWLAVCFRVWGGPDAGRAEAWNRSHKGSLHCLTCILEDHFNVWLTAVIQSAPRKVSDEQKFAVTRSDLFSWVVDLAVWLLEKSLQHKFKISFFLYSSEKLCCCSIKVFLCYTNLRKIWPQHVIFRIFLLTSYARKLFRDIVQLNSPALTCDHPLFFVPNAIEMIAAPSCS